MRRARVGARPLAFLLSLASLVAGARTSAAAVDVPMTAAAFDLVPNTRTPLRSDARATFAAHLGRPALAVPHGLALVHGVDFRDGTIEADVATREDGLFFGIAFRVESPDEYELIYFRAFASGTVEAVQYAPVLHGALVWQLLQSPAEKAAAEIPQERWRHVRIEVEGRRARLFLDGARNPVLVVDRLRHGDGHGRMGFWGLFRGGWVSRLEYTLASPRAQGSLPDSTLPAGCLADWSLSEAFDVARVDPAAPPQGLHWEAVRAEPPGFVLVNRYRESPEIMPTPSHDAMQGRYPGARVVFAKTTLVSTREEDRLLTFGYSDDLVIFLNGRRLFSGRNAWRFREPEALGAWGWNDAVVLPLQRGANELVFAVTEYMGGWGFGAKIETGVAGTGTSGDPR